MNHVLIGISGGIAAYKVCEVVSSLAKRGIKVRVILTKSAAEFVTPLTFATLSRQPAYTDADFWQPSNGRPLHIELAEWADIFLLAPVTANTLAKLAYGFEPEIILEYLESFLFTNGKQDLKGKKILVNAGGTREFIDPVRFIGNPSTGKQGIVIAKAAMHRGANVTLITASSVSLSMGEGLGVRVVRTAAEMHKAMLEEFPLADITIAAAAIGDVRSQFQSDRKLPKSELPLNLELEYIPDIVADLARRKRSDQLLVGFAAQTGNDAEVLSAAKEKLARKGLDAIAANAVNSSQTGFGTDTNQATFIHKNGNTQSTPLCSKLEIAHRLLDFLI
jgi:phosphopantothenoylcysteine decarboxylase / phosphopantothenate---cysteine ligase